jgi:hypothetical protein
MILLSAQCALQARPSDLPLAAVRRPATRTVAGRFAHDPRRRDRHTARLSLRLDQRQPAWRIAKRREACRETAYGAGLVKQPYCRTHVDGGFCWQWRMAILKLKKGEKVPLSIDIPVTIVIKQNVDQHRSLFK